MEIAFEQLMLALESTRGTAIAAPTHLVSLDGFVKPIQRIYRPPERRGTLVKNYRSVITQKEAEWQASGAIDTATLPVYLNMLIKAVTSPSTPGGATLARLWTFVRSITADDIKTATLWYADPNVQAYRAAFATLDELTIKSDSDTIETAQITLKGHAGFPAAVADPTVPASINTEIGLMISQKMQLWLDNASAIGTTEITGRLLSIEHTIPSGITYKRYAASTTTTYSYTQLGREPTAAKTKLVFEVPDTTQYDNWAAGDTIKCRARHFGGIIEGGTHSYIEFDIYGQFDMFDWSTYKNTNRTIEMTIESEYDATAAVDYSVKVLNARTAL